MKPGAISHIDRLESLHPDIVFDFLENGISSAIPKDMQQFIMQVQWASEIWERERNTVRAARKLKERVLVNQKIKISLITAKARVFQAMEYFDVDHNIPQEIWDRDAANKFEDLAKLAIAQDKLSEAGRFLEKSNELRKRANSALRVNDLQMPQFLITTTITPEDLGYTDKNMLEISKKATEGFYVKLINGLPVSKEDKKRLLSDAQIQDVEYEEMDEDHGK